MLLCISGSLRKASTNRKLLAQAAEIYGGDVTVADIRLPLYDGDLEEAEGVPDLARTLHDQIGRAEAVLIGSAEYNYSVTGALKNALDWVSRIDGNPWRGKPVAIMSAAAGRSGGARSTFATHLVMTHFQPLFTKGPEILIASSFNAFDENDKLKDEDSTKFLTQAMEVLRDEARKD